MISQGYNLENVRNLLREGFSEAELRRLSFDVLAFRPVYNNLSEKASKDDIIDCILEYADQKVKVEALLKWARNSNPDRYKQLEPYHSPTIFPIRIKPRIGLFWPFFTVIVFTLGAISTWFVVHQVPVAEDNKSLSIESIPVTVSTYGGEGDPNVGKGTGRLFVIFDKNAHIAYDLDYKLPEDGYGYAGLDFRFSQAQDLSMYQLIEATFNFEDESARCDLVIEDISKESGYVPVGSGVALAPDITAVVNGKEQTISVPLETNYSSVNRKAIGAIGLKCDTDSSQGDHNIVISQIRFKP